MLPAIRRPAQDHLRAVRAISRQGSAPRSLRGALFVRAFGINVLAHM
jgi:hypothetical protein